jgi:hypothetical protein
MDVLSNLFKNGASAFLDGGQVSLTTIAASTTVFQKEITHNLNTRDVEVAVYRNKAPWDKVLIYAEMLSTTQIRLSYDPELAADGLRVMVWQPGLAGAPAIVAPASAMSTTIGSTTATRFTVTHNFGSRDVEVAVHRNVSPWDKVFVNVEKLTLNSIDLVFDVAPGLNSFRVMVWLPGSIAATEEFADLQTDFLQSKKVEETNLVPLLRDPFGSESNPRASSITDNLFSHDAEEEYSIGLTGQSTLVDPGVSFAASTLQAYFGLPTEDSTVRQHYPFMDLGGGTVNSSNGNVTTGYRNIPLSNITVRMYNSPLNHNLFQIANFQSRAITAFIYTGDQPLHTILDGHMNFLIRVGDVGSGTAGTKLRTSIYLRNDVRPVFDEDDDQVVGVALGSSDLPTIQLTAAEFTDGNGGTDATTVTAGAWLKKTISVKRLVNFQPGSTYRFVLVTSLISGDYKPVEWGLRIESGGFSCALDGSQILKRAVKNIMNAGA